MWLITRIVGPSMNPHKKSLCITDCKAHKRLSLFVSSLGHQYQKENKWQYIVDVHLLKVGISATICQQCGCWTLKNCKSQFIRQTIHRCVLWWLLGWGETICPTFNVSFKFTWTDLSVLLVVSWSSTKSGFGHSSGTAVFWKPGWPDSFTNHHKISMNNCVSTTALLRTIYFWLGVILPQRTQ